MEATHTWQRRDKCFRKSLSPFYVSRFSTRLPAWAVFMPFSPASAFPNWRRYCNSIRTFHENLGKGSPETYNGGKTLSSWPDTNIDTGGEFLGTPPTDRGFLL